MSKDSDFENNLRNIIKTRYSITLEEIYKIGKENGFTASITSAIIDKLVGYRFFRNVSTRTDPNIEMVKVNNEIFLQTRTSEETSKPVQVARLRPDEAIIHIEPNNSFDLEVYTKKRPRMNLRKFVVEYKKPL